MHLNDSIAESLRERVRLLEERAETERVRAEEMAGSHARLAVLERAASTAKREAEVEKELLRQRISCLENERLTALSTPSNKTGQPAASACGKCERLEEECGAALKRAEALEASMCWASTEFVTLHTEFLALCDEMQQIPASPTILGRVA